MMYIMKMKHHIFYALFLICFSFYVISPLSYTYEYKQYNEQIAGQGCPTVAGFRLFVLELLLSKLTHHESKKGSSSAHLLLLRKRVALSSEKLQLSKKPVKNFDLLSDSIPSSETPCITITAKNNELKFQNGFHSLCSGLSPPLVV